MADVRLILGDSREVLPTLEAESADSLVCDPPAGISFMGLEFDTFPLSNRERPNAAAQDARRGNGKGFNGIDTSPKGRAAFIAFLSSVMRESLRVLKPGAFGLVWALPRTSHWTATALEDAGFEIRDRVSHLFGTGFPKAKSCLKPACEDWWLVRKPGKMQALGIEECRIECAEGRPLREKRPNGQPGNSLSGSLDASLNGSKAIGVTLAGRWPANVVLSCCGQEPHDESCPVRLLDEQSGKTVSRSGGGTPVRRTASPSMHKGMASPGRVMTPRIGHDDSGGASRFFYTAKASRRDRGEGNTHPTVKSCSLMSWLVRLVTAPGGLVLDPFAGSGSTLKACLATGRHGLGIEISPEYHAIAQRRIAESQNAHPLFSAVSED